MAKRKTLTRGSEVISSPDTKVTVGTQSLIFTLTFPWGERDLSLHPQDITGRERSYLKYLTNPENQEYRARVINKVLGQEPWFRKGRRRTKGQATLDLE